MDKDNEIRYKKTEKFFNNINITLPEFSLPKIFITRGEQATRLKLFFLNF